MSSYTRHKREVRGDSFEPGAEVEGMDVDLLTVYTDVYNMRIELEKIKKPIGTRNSPARTCKDLHVGHPMMKDDFYWIDPNLGMVDDAVKVYCNMSAGGETCVFPDVHTSRMPNIPWRKSREGCLLDRPQPGDGRRRRQGLLQHVGWRRDLRLPRRPHQPYAQHSLEKEP